MYHAPDKLLFQVLTQVPQNLTSTETELWLKREEHHRICRARYLNKVPHKRFKLHNLWFHKNNQTPKKKLTSLGTRVVLTWHWSYTINTCYMGEDFIESGLGTKLLWTLTYEYSRFDVCNYTPVLQPKCTSCICHVVSFTSLCTSTWWLWSVCLSSTYVVWHKDRNKLISKLIS